MNHVRSMPTRLIKNKPRENHEPRSAYGRAVKTSGQNLSYQIKRKTEIETVFSRLQIPEIRRTEPTWEPYIHLILQIIF